MSIVEMLIVWTLAAMIAGFAWGSFCRLGSHSLDDLELLNDEEGPR